MNLKHLAFSDFVSLVSPLAASAATCSPTVFGDGVCDCGCGSNDTDCPAGTFKICQVSHCASGQVPWEHTPSACMASACGDGWKDTASGEVCDDGNALASGGCSANCKTVNPGYVCGEGASGCKLAPVDSGTPVVDAGRPDAGAAIPDAGAPVVDAGMPPLADAGTMAQPAPSGGCAAIPAPALALSALALWFTRRQASRRR